MAEAGVFDLSVADIMTRWPETTRVFIAHNLHCIGCPIAGFHTISDAADEHGTPLDDLAGAIEAAIERSSRIHFD